MASSQNRDVTVSRMDTKSTYFSQYFDCYCDPPSGESRLSDGVGVGESHPDPEIRGKGGSLKKIWSKNKGGPLLDPPLPARYLTPTNQSTYRSGSISGLTSLLNPVIPSIIVKKLKKKKSVRAARKVSTYWLHKTMTCHFFNCFSIFSGQG